MCGHRRSRFSGLRDVLLLVAGSLIVYHVGTSAQSGTAVPASVALTNLPYRALVDQYCVGCHNDRNKQRVANLALDVVDLSRPGERPEVWERVVRKVRAGLMPPAGQRRPEKAALDGFVGW